MTIDRRFVPLNNQIWIETKGVVYSGSPLFQHLYIVWTDVDGIERVLRADPFDNDTSEHVIVNQRLGIGGTLFGSEDARDTDTPADRYQTFLDINGFDGYSVLKYWAAFSALVNAAEIDYDLPDFSETHNSNAYVHSLLQLINIEQPEDSLPAGTSTLLTYPGFASSLLEEVPLPETSDIWGSAGNDSMLGTTAVDTMHGGRGIDFLDGQGGADILIGGRGNDVFIGYTGEGGLEGAQHNGGNVLWDESLDAFIGSAGLNDGFDTLDYSHVNHGISFEIQNRSGTAEKRGGGGEDDVFHSIERIHGTVHDDIFDVTSGVAGYVLSGLGGDDTYVIGTQGAVIEDRWGNNTLRIEGINAEDVWLRPVGNDLVIYGNFGGAARELTRSKGHFAPSGGGGEIGDPSAGEVPQNSDAADGAQGTPSIGMIEGTDENDDPVSKNPSTDKSDYPPEGIPLKEGGDEPEYPMQGEAPSISGIPRATYDPLVLDLDGDGIEITLLNKGTYYDLDLNGMAELVSWVRPDDGFLVHDIDENGVTTDAGELFGNATSDGFAALKLLDSDANGLINVSDAAWSKLMIWQDKSGDGYADAHEMKTLDEAGIAQILLGASKSTETVNGSALTHVSSFAYTSGEFSTIANVALQVDTANSEYKGAALLGANDNEPRAALKTLMVA